MTPKKNNTASGLAWPEPHKTMMRQAGPRLIIIAEKTAAQRLAKLVHVGGGILSTIEPEIISTPLESLPMLMEDGGDTVALVHATHTGGLDEWLAHVRPLENVAAVVITDDADVTAHVRANGLTAIAPDMGLTPALLETFVEMAQTVNLMKHRQNQVQQLYDMAERRFADMADQFADWLWEIDTGLILTFSSSRKRPLEGAGKGSSFIDCFLPEERLRIEDDFAELVRTGKSFHDRDYWSSDTYGVRYCWSLSGMPVIDITGKIVGFRGIAKDTSAIKATADQLYHLINHDALTGLMNRSRFLDELTRTLRIAKREGRTGALLLIDVDRFAVINQVHGYGIGDKLLVHVSAVLKDSIRSSDMVARLDGDQFAILLRDIRAEDTVARMERLQATLGARPFHTDKGGLILTMSGGYAFYTVDGGDADVLLSHAGAALHFAKQRGPARIERFTPSHMQATDTRNSWLTTLTEAIANPDTLLEVHYQPIIPLSGRVSGEHYEALVRLKDNNGDIIPASRFITAAEEFGLVNKLDRVVTGRVIKALQHYHQIGRPMHISVNLSGKTFDDDKLFPDLVMLLREAQLPPQSLVFEMTETALLHDLPKVKEIMKLLKAAGAGFALDDCGVGYSSLNYIRHLELDYIKIDGTFIRNLHTNPDDQAFVKALADVAKQRGIATVAEMVEHEAAVAILQKLGVDFGQGFHFAPPDVMPEKGATKK